uniref:Transcription elongation factor Eaf N-terminal domain-containing protein n=1 Tax=Hyaloperonospora arabidopsidis (strain Emoy2) TaxID=559515 RepID=M4B3Z5_HYAAE
MSSGPTPLDDHEYPVVLGESLLDAPNEEQSSVQPSDEVFASFGYEFQPASVDKRTPGLVSVDASSSVQVLMSSSTGAAGGVSFRGKVLEHKETDCLLLFDGSQFRLERCQFSCTQLRHVRVAAPRRRGTCQRERENSSCNDTAAATITGTETELVSGEEGASVASMVEAVAIAKKPVRRSQRQVSVGKATAADAVKRPRGRPKESTKVAATKFAGMKRLGKKRRG